MFFFVMLVSASISVSVLVMVCSPVMKSNAEQQLVELSMAMDQLEEKGGFTVDEIVSIVNNSAYSLSVVDKNDSRVHDHFADIVHKGYYVSSEGVVPNATIISQVYDKFVIIDSFSSDSVYWVVNLVVIIAFMVCIVIGTIITAFMSRSIIQPIRDLSAAAAEIAKGNFKVRVREPSDPEYSILAQNFNKMAEELAGTETLRGDFISNVSHEFKTPLASIQGFAKLLQSDDITEQEREEYTQIIIDETSRLSKLSSNILRLTKLENQNAQLDRIACIDALTGLYNRRSMDKFLAAAMSCPNDFSIIMCDIDDFKKVNDTYGHKSGDKVLQAISKIIVSGLREDDFVCRWGGEEILILISGTSLNPAAMAAERIRSQVEKMSVDSDGQAIKCTLTIGVAERSEGKSTDDIIALADERLYKGKRSGKNRVVES